MWRSDWRELVLISRGTILETRSDPWLRMMTRAGVRATEMRKRMR